VDALNWLVVREPAQHKKRACKAGWSALKAEGKFIDAVASERESVTTGVVGELYSVKSPGQGVDQAKWA